MKYQNRQKINIKNVFESIAKQLRNGVISQDSIAQDFTDLHEILNNLKVDYFEPSLIEKLTDYIMNLNKTTNLLTEKFPDPKENPILKTLKSINEKAVNVSRDESIKSLNNLIYRSLTLKHNEMMKEIDDFFNENLIICQINEADVTAKKKSTEKTNFGARTYEMEEAKLQELKQKNKDTYPTIRRLIIAICKEFKHKKINNPNGRINELLDQLPDSELTPLLCQELMRFHFLQTKDMKQAVSFYEKMISKLVSSEFEISKQTTILFVQVCCYLRAVLCKNCSSIKVNN